jgi:hypothetical protein
VFHDYFLTCPPVTDHHRGGRFLFLHTRFCAAVKIAEIFVATKDMGMIGGNYIIFILFYLIHGQLPVGAAEVQIFGRCACQGCKSVRGII